jgi:hypothetical protein
MQTVHEPLEFGSLYFQKVLQLQNGARFVIRKNIDIDVAGIGEVIITLNAAVKIQLGVQVRTQFVKEIFRVRRNFVFRSFHY